jgi:hypothetical protein
MEFKTKELGDFARQIIAQSSTRRVKPQSSGTFLERLRVAASQRINPVQPNPVLGTGDKPKWYTGEFIPTDTQQENYPPIWPKYPDGGSWTEKNRNRDREKI